MTYPCIFNLTDTGDCVVLEKIREKNEKVYDEIRKEFGKPKFIKHYCSYCVKALYASRFKEGKYTVVNTL
jgi:hypothetical protein